MRRVVLIGLATGLAASAVLAGGSAATASPRSSGAAVGAHSTALPKVIALPNGFRPEGIATGRAASFYAGSLADGAVYRGSLITGRGSVLVPGQPGSAATGMKVDRKNRLFVSGGPTGQGRVYDAATGAPLASYQFAAAGTSFVNDVVVTRDAAYFTDSLQPVLYVLRFGRHGGLPTGFETLPFSGDLVYQAGFNANGIETTPDGHALLVVQSNTGLLFRVNPHTGTSTTVDLGGASLSFGDGLLRRGRTLYAVRNQLNQIAVIQLNRSGSAGVQSRTITDPAFDVPTTIARFGPFLYAVNARFSTPPTPDTEYTIVQVPAR
jgi:sugar lactone lactonase YvrE